MGARAHQHRPRPRRAQLHPRVALRLQVAHSGGTDLRDPARGPRRRSRPPAPVDGRVRGQRRPHREDDSRHRPSPDDDPQGAVRDPRPRDDGTRHTRRSRHRLAAPGVGAHRGDPPRRARREVVHAAHHPLLSGVLRRRRRVLRRRLGDGQPGGNGGRPAPGADAVGQVRLPPRPDVAPGALRRVDAGLPVRRDGHRDPQPDRPPHRIGRSGRPRGVGERRRRHHDGHVLLPVARAVVGGDLLER